MELQTLEEAIVLYQNNELDTYALQQILEMIQKIII